MGKYGIVCCSDFIVTVFTSPKISVKTLFNAMFAMREQFAREDKTYEILRRVLIFGTDLYTSLFIHFVSLY